MSKALILRTCDKDHKATAAPVAGTRPRRSYRPGHAGGNAAAGCCLLWGAGDAGLISQSPNATWKVVEVDEDSIVDLGGKVKVPWRRRVLRHATRPPDIGRHGGKTKGCHWISPDRRLHADRRRPGTLTGGNEHADRRLPKHADRRRPKHADRRQRAR